MDEYEHYKPGIGGWVGSDGHGYMDIEPKVFLPHDRAFAPPRAPPRKVEVERCDLASHRRRGPRA